MLIFFNIGLYILFLCSGVYSKDRECLEVSTLNPDYLQENIIVIGHGELSYKLLEHFRGEVIQDPICPVGVEETIKATKLLPDKYIINIDVDDFYKFNYADVSKYLLFAGDTKNIAYNTSACVIDFRNNATTKLIADVNCSEERCYNTAVLVSHNVADNPELLEIINDYVNDLDEFEFIDKPPTTVLICHSKENKILRNINLERILYPLRVIYSDDCENDMKMNQMKLLAILAPKPVESDYDVLVPIVLYKAQCYENIPDMTNYVQMIKSCDDYKLALLAFMKQAGWERAAIISDNIPYNEYNEKGISELFHNNGIAHTVVRCVEHIEGGCQFQQALKSLKANDTRVFIANVDKNNLLNIYYAVPHLWKKSNKYSSWIVIEDNLDHLLTSRMGEIFTIYLAPTIRNNALYDHLGIGKNQARFPICSQIIEAIVRIKTAYNKIKDEYDSRQRRVFFRELAKAIQIQIPSSTTAYFTKNGRMLQSVLGSIKIQNGETTYIHRDTKFKFRPDMDQCTMKSGIFHRPCDENNFLLVMVVFVILAASALLMTMIKIYFCSPSPTQYRYL